MNATCRGTSHVRDNLECQDNVRCLATGDIGETLIAVVSDGAGSAPFSKQGSIIVCRTISESVRHHLQGNQVISDEDIWSWIDLARDRITAAASSRGRIAREFAATLIAVIAMPHECVVLHIGDGAAVCKIDGQWTVPSWPAHGEYASTTYFVTDDPSPDLRITRLPIATESVAVFSDGIERLVLRFADQTASALFFDNLCATVVRKGHTGASATLNAGLKLHLDSPKFNGRTDDDKSLIVAVRT